MAATVAPRTVSGGVDRLRTGRFQRATTRITPVNETTLTRKAMPTPVVAIRMPASAGPTARAMLNSMALRAEAAGRSSLVTNSGSIARQVGVSNASPADNAKVSARRSQGVIAPVRVTAASATATHTIQASVKRIS